MKCRTHGIELSLSLQEVPFCLACRQEIAREISDRVRDGDHRLGRPPQQLAVQFEQPEGDAA